MRRRYSLRFSIGQSQKIWGPNTGYTIMDTVWALYGQNGCLVFIDFHEQSFIDLFGIEELLLKEISVFLNIFKCTLKFTEDPLMILAHLIKFKSFRPKPVPFLL
jgi:hypothetical protein